MTEVLTRIDIRIFRKPRTGLFLVPSILLNLGVISFQSQTSIMITVKEIPLITVQIAHYRQSGIAAGEDVDFKIFRENNQLKAIPLMSKEERLTTQLPKELVFVYANHCITAAENMDGESLDAINQIVLEMKAQQLL